MSIFNKRHHAVFTQKTKKNNLKSQNILTARMRPFLEWTQGWKKMARQKGFRIFRASYTDRSTGRRMKSRKWYIDFADHKQRRHRLAATTDKRSTEALARNIEAFVGCRIGGQRPDAELQRWLEGLCRLRSWTNSCPGGLWTAHGQRAASH
ncbi:MAG: hypothetical protein DRP66_04585 [Planctomycetota bacterium]|nr:MAG: hypothetical protein DRP66_04585 [Planctomycetota bacterium]